MVRTGFVGYIIRIMLYSMISHINISIIVILTMLNSTILNLTMLNSTVFNLTVLIVSTVSYGLISLIDIDDIDMFGSRVMYQVPNQCYAGLIVLVILFVVMYIMF